MGLDFKPKFRQPGSPAAGQAKLADLYGRSVQIRLGKRESILDQFDTRFRIVCHDHLHHVEPEKNIWIIEHSQPREGAAGYSLLFCAVHGRNRPAEIFARPRFYFDEHQRVVIAAHNVNFAATASTEIAERIL